MSAKTLKVAGSKNDGHIYDLLGRGGLIKAWKSEEIHFYNISSGSLGMNQREWVQLN